MRLPMYNTHDGRKCVWTARRRCPGGVKTGDGPKQLLGSCSCTMLDVRCTIWEIRARCAGRGRRERRLCTTEAPSGAYVRCTIWKFGEPPARGILRSVGGGGWEEQSAGVIRRVSNFAELFPRLCYLVHRQPHFLVRLKISC